MGQVEKPRSVLIEREDTCIYNIIMVTSWLMCHGTPSSHFNAVSVLQYILRISFRGAPTPLVYSLFMYILHVNVKLKVSKLELEVYAHF